MERQIKRSPRRNADKAVKLFGLAFAKGLAGSWFFAAGNIALVLGTCVVSVFVAGSVYLLSECNRHCTPIIASCKGIPTVCNCTIAAYNGNVFERIVCKCLITCILKT